MSSTVPFSKSFSKPHDLVSLLISRGLSIQNPAKAERYIERIGYYRLSAYMYPFLNQPKNQHHFKKGASFAKVLMLYRFDKKFRLLLFNEIEKIEIAVRTAIVDAATSIIGDPFWMTNMENYVSQNRFNKTMLLIDNELRHTREDFIIHFRETYSDSYPPAWILSEILPFGVITNIYSNIKISR